MNNIPLLSLRQFFVSVPLFALIFTFMISTPIAYAINDITIDGDLSDWADENGLFTDPHGDTTPARTDITQFGLAVIDNGANPESLALMMVTDTFHNGNATGDSHKLIFGAGIYEIVVTIENGCDNVVNVTLEDTSGVAGPVVLDPATYSAALGIINPPINAPAPINDATPDCALEIEFPITTLPALDTDTDGELLDESFVTNFVTRQSGGVGNDNDVDGVGGVTPTAVALQHMATSASPSYIIFAGIMFALMLALTTLTLRRRYATS